MLLYRYRNDLKEEWGWGAGRYGGSEVAIKWGIFLHLVLNLTTARGAIRQMKWKRKCQNAIYTHWT